MILYYEIVSLLGTFLILHFLIICELFEPSDLKALAYAGQLLLSLTNTVYF